MKEDLNLLEEVRQQVKEERENPKPKPARKPLGKVKKILLITLGVVVLIAIDTTLVLIATKRIADMAKLGTLTVQSPLVVRTSTQRVIYWEWTADQPKEQIEGVQNTRNTTKAQLTQEEKDNIIKDYGLYNIVKTVSILESGAGTNPQGHHVECSNVGYTNEFGYFRNGDRSYCFPTYEESVEVVTAQFMANLQTMTLPQSLCYYNEGAPGGLVRSDCKYAQDFYSIYKERQ